MNNVLVFDHCASAVDIMEVFWKNTYNPEQFGSLDEFINWSRTSLWKFHKIGINLDGDLSLEEKCENIVFALKFHNLLNIK